MKKLFSEGKSFTEISFIMKISFWTVKYNCDEKYREQIKKRSKISYNLSGRKDRRKNGKS